MLLFASVMLHRRLDESETRRVLRFKIALLQLYRVVWDLTARNVDDIDLCP